MPVSLAESLRGGNSPEHGTLDRPASLACGRPLVARAAPEPVGRTRRARAEGAGENIGVAILNANNELLITA